MLDFAWVGLQSITLLFCHLIHRSSYAYTRNKKTWMYHYNLLLIIAYESKYQEGVWHSQPTAKLSEPCIF